MWVVNASDAAQGRPIASPALAHATYLHLKVGVREWIHLGDHINRAGTKNKQRPTAGSHSSWSLSGFRYSDLKRKTGCETRNKKKQNTTYKCVS